VIQEHTPPQLLGRVFGALTALAQAGIPIGAVLAGVVVQRAGLIPTIVGRLKSKVDAWPRQARWAMASAGGLGGGVDRPGGRR
jgi:hypothetical protein